MHFTLSSSLFILSILLLCQCNNSQSNDDRLNKELLISHQEFLQDQEVLKGEHKDWTAELKQWKTQLEKLKRLDDPLFVEHKTSLEAHANALTKHDSLIQVHKTYLNQQNSINEAYAMGKMSDEEFQNKHDDILEKHNKVLKEHEHIRELHKFIKDAHQAILSAIKK